MIDHNTIYIGKRKIHCPDWQQFTAQHPHHAYAPINGYDYVMAAFTNVFDRPTLWTCVGWILSEDLGFRSAKDWIAANPDWEKKYGNCLRTVG